MGDMGDIFRAYTQAKKERHANNKVRNLQILRDSGLEFAERPEACLFRGVDKPKVDFFPSTGRWRVPALNRTFSGGAEAFIAWYRKQ